MDLQGMTADSGGSYEPMKLEPFIHQVGGHSSMLQLDADTICKPLIEQEHDFYNSAPEALKEFMAEYKGIIEVTFSEAVDGYIDLTTYLPPTCQISSIQQSSRRSSLPENEQKLKHRYNLVTGTSPNVDLGGTISQTKILFTSPDVRIRLCQSGSIKIESISLDDTTKKYEEHRSKAHNGSLLNPWVLHCHQKQLKRLQKSSSAIKYILLENRVSKYEFPCILDIKMGTRQYGDSAPLSKRRSHTAKAASSTSAILGVRVSGMQVYHEESGHYICHNKYYGRSLTVEGFQQTLYNFLHDGVKLRLKIVSILLERLRKLHSVIKTLNTFRFFTSSLLIIYNGREQCYKRSKIEDHELTRLRDNGNVAKDKKRLEQIAKTCDKCSVSGGLRLCTKHLPKDKSKDHVPQPVDLCMIDFAYSTHSQMPDCPVIHEGPDEGYLFGLENLISHLELILQAEK